MEDIRKIKLFINNNTNSLKLGEEVANKFINNGFNIDNIDFQLAIAIGGDGSFLRMIRDNNFNSNIYYVGINSGTLGFLQEVKDIEIDKLIYEILNNKYKVDNIGIQESDIYYDNGKISNYYSLNEIVIRDIDLKMVKYDVLIDNDYLEYFVGDGLLIATSQGSTAHNLSYGGSIVYNNFSTLQITPIGPINSKVYRTLNNSIIIPDKKNIIIKPINKNNLLITIDGWNYSFNNVDRINTSIKDKKIKCLRFSHYNFPEKINEKLLSNN